MIRHIIQSMIFASSLTFLLPTCLAAQCTRDQAFNKMMALGKARQEMMATPNTSRSAIAALAKDVTSVGQILADENYDLACRRYDEIAAKHNIDLTRQQEGMITMEELRNDGGKRGGECSAPEASKRVMGYMNQLQDKTALGDIDGSEMAGFMAEMQKFGPLLYTDPSQYCKEADAVAKRYGL